MLLRAGLLATIACGTSSHAADGLRAARNIGPKPVVAAAEPVVRASADSDVPLRLEYEVITHIEHMAQTTQELRAIVDTLPGPGLPAEKSTALPEVQYASTIEETRVRLNHVEQLIADITRIIMVMPLTGKPAAPISAIPVVPAPAAPTPAAPAPTPPITVAAVALAAPPPKLAAPSPPASKPARQPITLPEPVSQALESEKTFRGILLLIGGVIAAVLAINMRRRFLRRNPSRKELAASIGNVPIKDEALELADVMSSMGMGDGAAQTLVERIKANPRQALTHWLKLLDVYRKTGKREEFEKAADEMRTAFNVKPGSWDGSDKHADASVENYPHIAKQIKELWPKPECSEYLLSLLADNRDGQREGFPLAVIEEIVLLLAVLRGDEPQPA